jgi:hypothetical protein
MRAFARLSLPISDTDLQQVVGCRVSDRQETEGLYPARGYDGPEQNNLPELLRAAVTYATVHGKDARSR